MIVGLLINGVAYAAIFIVIALLIRRFTNAAVWRVFVVVSLFVAAALYVVFALRAGESTFWIVTEVVGVAIFGGFGQFIVTWLIKATGSPIAPAYYVMACSLATILALRTIPEMRGRILD